jgi:hypothetical protein
LKLGDGMRQFSFSPCQFLWSSVGMQRSKPFRLQAEDMHCPYLSRLPFIQLGLHSAFRH